MRKSKLLGCLCGWQSTAAVAAGWLALAVVKSGQFLLDPASRNGFDVFLLAAWVFFAAAYARKAVRQRSAAETPDEEGSDDGSRHE